MLLAVDIGNTSTKFGLFDRDEMVSKFAVPTHSHDLIADINGRLDGGFDSAVVCSVVPDAAQRLQRLVSNGFGVEPVFVTGDIDLGLAIKHTPISTLGPDRLVNSFAAAETYGTPVIVIGLGTATTVDVVNDSRELLGGLIAPGMLLMAQSLHEHTAKLPDTEVGRTNELLGTNTEDAIRSGIYLSLIGFIDTAVGKILDKIGEAKVVATGGFASLVESGCSYIDVVDENLTLQGLNLISNRNTSAKSSAPS